MKSLLKNIRSNKFTLFLAIGFFFQACSINKLVPEDEIVLQKSKVNNAPSEIKSDLKSLMKQNPRQRVFGLTTPLNWIYLKTENAEKSWLNTRIQRLAGEEPVYLDTFLTYESARQMKDFLVNKGYFHSSVDYSIEMKEKKAFVEYNIHYSEPYTIGNVEYYIADKSVNQLIANHISETLIVKGEAYDSDLLIDERERLTRIMNNNGYYKFGKNYIFYEVDTTFNENKTVEVNLYIRNLSDTSRHKRYLIKNITIEPNYTIIDTLRKDSVYVEDFLIVSSDNIIKYDLFSRHVKFSPGDIYQINKVRQTINQLSELQLFKFIDISFTENPEDSSEIASLDCYIRLTPMEKQEYDLELEANTTEENKQLSTALSTRYYGMAGSFTYRNRNIFKRAIQWSLKAGGAFDVPISDISDQQFFGNYQIEANTALYFPTAFLPASINRRNISQTSKTALNLSYFFEQNQDFKRNTANLSYIYQFNNPLVRHFVTPMEFSLVRTDLQADFAKLLDQYNDPLLDNVFETHLLTEMRYTIAYNDKSLNKRHFWRIRANIPETAGNIPWLYNLAAHGKQSFSDTMPFEILQTNFFQYLKFDLDVSHHFNFNIWSSLASRIALGLGMPFGNSTVLPYEKQYYLGGANSMRAWPLRGLGPGAYKKIGDLRFEQTGEIKFETNLEYRFDIISFLKGALFVDAGNIWTLREDDVRPDGVFEAHDFISEIAIGSGFGLRFDFVFFIFRTDFAFPLRDPSRLPANRWVVDDTQLKDFRIKIGIGYPF